MNETYEWLYDHYALPLMKASPCRETLKKEICSLRRASDELLLQDHIDDLCLLVGTEAFSIGLQLGLRLMAGQRADTLTIL